MKVLLVYNGADGLGGIETLMARIATCFAERGDETICLLREANPIRHLFPPAVRVISACRNLVAYLDVAAFRGLAQDNALSAIDAIIAMDGLSAIIAPLISWVAGTRQCRCLATNWVPNYLDRLVERPLHPMSMLHRWAIQRYYGEHSLLFMNRHYEAPGKKLFGPKWTTTLFPVSVNAGEFDAVERRPVPGRIVSIGRLQPMKEYNFYMIDVVDRLRRKGFDVTWEVYGYGEFEESMRAEIVAKGLSDFIALKGTLSRDQVPAVLASAQLFVGMGRAVMEAAVAGVPHAVAIAYDRTGVTHGPLYHASLGNIGDREKDRGVVRVEEELERILRMSKEDYAAESAKVRNDMRRYEEAEVMKILFSAADLAPPSKAGWLFRAAGQVYGRLRASGIGRKLPH